MRKLLFICFLFPSVGWAQKLSLGINAGAMFFSGMHSDYKYYTAPLKTQVYSSMTLTLRLNKYDVALRFAGSPLEGNYSNYYLRGRIFAQNPVQITVMGNRHMQLSAFDVYGGLTAGVISYKNGTYADMVNLYPTAEIASSAGTGSVLGLQAGCNYAISRRIDLNFEVDADYVNIKSENEYLTITSYPMLTYNYSYFSYPVSVGIKYKFGKDARKVRSRN